MMLELTTAMLRWSTNIPFIEMVKVAVTSLSGTVHAATEDRYEPLPQQPRQAQQTRHIPVLMKATVSWIRTETTSADWPLTRKPLLMSTTRDTAHQVHGKHGGSPSK